MMKPLNEKEIKNKLSALSSNWVYNNNTLEGRFQFRDFLTALDFVNTVGKVAEKYKHHPEIHVNFSKVTLFLTTHDLNNQLSQKDFDLAVAVEKSSLECGKH
jgi:4a-hydroxytetrahydrobiopterin dehydratase